MVSPPGEAKADWEILDLLFEKLGHPKRYASLQRIREEISRLVPSYGELGQNGKAFWIQETSDRRLFNPDGEGAPIPFSPVISMDDEISDEAYPFKAILGSIRYHLGSGTRTGYSKRINDFTSSGSAEISPEDGIHLDLKEGDKVRISSPHGSISRGVILNKDMRRGQIFIPTAFHENNVMGLIAFKPVGDADSPGWKECSVKIEKLGD